MIGAAAPSRIDGEDGRFRHEALPCSRLESIPRMGGEDYTPSTGRLPSPAAKPLTTHHSLLPVFDRPLRDGDGKLVVDTFSPVPRAVALPQQVDYLFKITRRTEPNHALLDLSSRPQNFAVPVRHFAE